MEGNKVFFIGEVGNVGSKLGYEKGKLKPVKTVIITDLVDLDGNYITDHVWVKYSMPLVNSNVEIGNKIKFRATIKRYLKEINGKLSHDYGLTYLSKIEVLQ